MNAHTLPLPDLPDEEEELIENNDNPYAFDAPAPYLEPVQLHQFLERRSALEREYGSDNTGEDEHDYSPRRSTPDRIVRLTSLILATGAMIASSYVIDSCEFLSIHGLDDTTTNSRLPVPMDQIPGHITVFVGIFGFAREEDEFCEPYYALFQEPPNDSWFWLAQMASLCAPAIAFLAWIVLCFSMWVSKLAATCMDNFRLASIMLYMATFFQMGSFLQYLQSGLCYNNEGRTCYLELFGGVAVIATVLYFIAATILLLSKSIEMYYNENCLSSQTNRRRLHHQSQLQLRSSLASDVVSISSLDSMDSRDFQLFQKRFFGSSLFKKARQPTDDHSNSSLSSDPEQNCYEFGTRRHVTTSSNERLQRATERRRRSSSIKMQQNNLAPGGTNATPRAEDYSWQQSNNATLEVLQPLQQREEKDDSSTLNDDDDDDDQFHDEILDRAKAKPSNNEATTSNSENIGGDHDDDIDDDDDDEEEMIPLNNSRLV